MQNIFFDGEMDASQFTTAYLTWCFRLQPFLSLVLSQGVWVPDPNKETKGAWPFDVHGRGITRLTVDSGNNNRVLTSSYDGSTRVTDIHANNITEVRFTYLPCQLFCVDIFCLILFSSRGVKWWYHFCNTNVNFTEHLFQKPSVVAYLVYCLARHCCRKTLRSYNSALAKLRLCDYTFSCSVVWPEHMCIIGVCPCLGFQCGWWLRAPDVARAAGQ